MKIDGYVAPDKTIALEQGVDFSYETPYGDIEIRSKMAGRDNFQFRQAMMAFDQWSGRRKALNKGKVDSEADRRLVGILYDHLVISWSTTVKSEGKEISASRENFVDLLTSAACENVVSVYMKDASDEENFRPLSTEEASGNSPTPSDGSSSGATRKNSSEA